MQPRDFLIDADTGQSQPQSVAIDTIRNLNLDVVPGVEAPSPVTPTINATQLLIANVLCSPTGIVSIAQATVNQIDSVEDLSNRVASLESFASTISGQVATLATALSALAAQLKNFVTIAQYSQLVTLVHEIWVLIHTPSITYAWMGTDNFLDSSQSSIAGTNIDGLYNCSINEGLRFAGTNASSTGVLTLLNPNDPNALVGADGWLLPTPSGARARLDCSFTNLPWIPDAILQYTYWSFTIQVLHKARHRHRCGAPYLPNPNAQVWWYQAQLDPCIHILSFPTESWEIQQWNEIAEHCQEDDFNWPQHEFERNLYFWRDYTDQPYWAKVVDTYPQTGNHVCQTFLNPQDGWLTSVTVYMHTNLASPLTIMISGCSENGTPDQVNQTLSFNTLTGPVVADCFDSPVFVGDLSVYTGSEKVGYKTVDIYENVPQYIYPCRIPIPPVFLQAGMRYGLHILTANPHIVSISNDFSCFAVHQGAYWVSGSSGLYKWNSTTNPKSLRFTLWYATWGQWQGQTNPSGGDISVTVQMNSLQLSGGIGGVDILADLIEPAVTKVNYEVQIGGIWYPFTDDPNNPSFSTNPTLVPLEVQFVGTTDLMPGLSLTNNQVTVTGNQQTAFHHISAAFVPAANISHIQLVLRLVGYNPTYHTFAATINVAGTNHYATPFSTTKTVNPDGSQTWVVVYNQAVNSGVSFYVELDGTTSSAAQTFFVAQQIVYTAP